MASLSAANADIKLLLGCNEKVTAKKEKISVEKRRFKEVKDALNTEKAKLEK